MFGCVEAGRIEDFDFLYGLFILSRLLLVLLVKATLPEGESLLFYVND